MFNTSYPFIFRMSEKVEGEPYRRLHRFAFRCKRNERYAVLLEEYEGDFFGIKFFRNALSKSSKRFQQMTNFYDAPVVINTCLEIMRYKLNENPRASFGFTGAPLESEKDDVTKPTKRFRLYKRIVENLFSPERFVHYQVEQANIYLLINRTSESPQELANWATEMLRQNYEF
jgi:hypothetical protein